MKKSVLAFLFLANLLIGQDRAEFRLHSHNDYLQNVPFWKALSAGFSSMEVDVFLVDDALFVAHRKEEIIAKRTFELLYLDPLRKMMALGLERPEKLQLLIDIKSEPYTTLDAIIESLEKYPEIIDNQTISIVISGNRPKPSDYVNYPDFILFDYQSLDKITDSSVLDKIGLISLSFRNLSAWNGKGRLTANDLKKVTATIKKAHSFGKPFRFWATPDSKTAWKALVHLGVDFINTDHPFACAQYLKTLAKREYQNSAFSEVYRPSFETDGKNHPVENIILLIGDGNGLAQISATALANNGELSLTQLRNIGFLKTQSSDDFTTDSAGSATAMATGQKVRNRAIGVDDAESPLANITEILSKKGYVSGIVTTDEITGATPAAFYAHQKDRSMVKEIIGDLHNSRLAVFVGYADQTSKEKHRVANFEMLASLKDISQSKKEKIGFLFSNEEKVTPLSKAVKNVLNFLDQKKKPFFLMVEGAKIDSNGHANNIGGIVNEGIAFDQAITEALKFADHHKNTLVIITADHETGGLTLPQGDISKNEIEGDFTTDDHTGVMVPVFAYGPKSNDFQGIYSNHQLFDKMLRTLDISFQE